MSKKAIPLKLELNPPFKSIDCETFEEMSLRIRFQDWITLNVGCLGIEERNRLWSKFKRGKLIKVRRKTIPFKV